jgi:hypothetical protein
LFTAASVGLSNLPSDVTFRRSLRPRLPPAPQRVVV